MVKKIEQRSECPISTSLELWGDKWSLLIIRDMMFFGKRTYGDFLNSKEKIATNILASRLIDLENAGLIMKKESAEARGKHIYQLTPKGVDLLPIIAEINLWGNKYYDISAPAKMISKALKQDKAGFIKQKTAELKKL